jgi:phosphoribosylaminoimidazolecarboxamide formyltransferase / IMP cyclohydrolase
MPQERLQTAYRTVMDDHLPKSITMDCDFDGNVQQLRYEKATWIIEGVEKGLRYGENPGQEAALYKLMNGNLVFGNVRTILPGRFLASDVELLQSGKHPGKTNITDTDNALNILRYFSSVPCVSIMKHNNPCGVAIGDNLLDAYQKANMADRVAAFGGTIALNRAVTRDVAQSISENYSEVVVAPEFEEGVMDIFAAKKNLRVMQIRDMARLEAWVGERCLDFKSLIDGGLVVQASYVPEAVTLDDIKGLPLGYDEKKGAKITTTPTEQQYRDMWFGWLVESGITSNSVIYVKNGVTIGIGTGEQDRVGVAEIARDKAYTKAKDCVCWQSHKIPYNQLLEEIDHTSSENRQFEFKGMKEHIDSLVQNAYAGLTGSVMVSDAFFPKRDGVDVGLREGIGAIIQPGGSICDSEVIEACNEAGVPMVFTGQRSFKH